MNNLYGFFGTHGVGKTTLCEALKGRGFEIDTDSVPRKAQALLGWDSLKRVEESEENLWAMQDLVLKLLIERDERILTRNYPTFVDRTPVDVAGYTALWAERRGWKIDMARYNAFIEDCRVACRFYTMQFFVPIREEIAFVAQHNRGDEAGRIPHQHHMCKFVNDQAIVYTSVHELGVDTRAYEVECAISHKPEKTPKAKPTTLIRDLMDSDGENRAVRTFLSLYGGTNGGAIDTKRMRYQLKMSGFEGCWPEWANNDETLTKAGAQLWIRHLFALENQEPK